MSNTFDEYLSQFDLSVIESTRLHWQNREGAGELQHADIEQLIMLAESAPLMMFLLDASGRLIYLNRAFMQKRGLTLEELSGFKWERLIHPDDRERALDTIRAAVGSQQPYSVEARCKGGDDVYRWYLFLCEPKLTEADKIYYIGICQDITASKQAISGDRAAEETPKINCLTKRELELLRYIVEGYTNQQIAELLIISEVTVKNHVANIIRKLKVKNRTQAAFFAQKTGII